jgi:outer membrane protein OmpA-like peptidoglycan-associated protein
MSKETSVSRIESGLAAIAAFFLLFAAWPALAQDADGCHDNPLIGRFQGASISYCKFKDFDELVFLRAPHDYGALLDRNATRDRSGPEWVKQQGKASEIRYDLPAGSSSLEVAANYEAELKAMGFQVVFSCADQECLAGNLRDLYLLGEQLDPTNGVSTAYADRARYLFAQLQKPEGTVYVSVLTGEDKDVTAAFLRLLETKGIESGKIAAVPPPDDLSTALAVGGSANVYGILFDYDQDTVKAESKPALDDIAGVMTSQPALRLKIIGHTDNVGGEAYNMDLSTRRASNVAAALVGGHGIDPSRLSFEGAGMSRPIESNDTEEGRARNRRVELVVQ